MNDPQGILLDAIKTAWLANKAAEEGLEIFSEVQFGEKSPSEDPDADAARGLPYCVVSAEASTLAAVSDISQHWMHEIIFHVYDETYAKAKTAAGVIWTTFTEGFADLADSPLALSSGDLIKVRPITSGFMREDRRIYSWEIRMQFETRHAR